jgi:hypothetical protein
MRQALFMLIACLTGALALVVILSTIVAIAFALGGREWTEHFGEEHWQTFVYMITAAGITGLAMWPVSRFLQRRLLR